MKINTNKSLSRFKEYYYHIVIFILSPIIKILWIEKVHGISNLPKNGPYIIISNHSSYLDFLCLAAVNNQPLYFLAAEVFFKKWWWWPIVKWTGHIKVERGNTYKKIDSLYLAVSYLNQNKTIGIFPEGSRSRTGNIGIFHNGFTWIAKQVNCPIIPASIKGTFNIWPPNKKLPILKKIVTIDYSAPLYQKSNESDEDFIERIRKIIRDNSCRNL